MLHLFGILSPGFGRRTSSAEAPNKADFFGGVADTAHRSMPLSRAEQDACYLSGKFWEPDPIAETAARPYAFVARYTP